MKFFKNHKLIAASMTLIVMAAVGFVYAAWTTNGSGNGYAQAGTSQALTTLDASGNTTADLVPGSSGNVQLTIHNTNTYPVNLTAVTKTGAITADAGHSGCTTTGVTFTDQSGLNVSVAANTDTNVTLTGAAHMDNTSIDACKGATFTIPVSLTGASA
jgi:uncharacterized protein with LGFP repeats